MKCDGAGALKVPRRSRGPAGDKGDKGSQINLAHTRPMKRASCTNVHEALTRDPAIRTRRVGRILLCIWGFPSLLYCHSSAIIPIATNYSVRRPCSSQQHQPPPATGDGSARRSSLAHAQRRQSPAVCGTMWTQTYIRRNAVKPACGSWRRWRLE